MTRSILFALCSTLIFAFSTAEEEVPAIIVSTDDIELSWDLNTWSKPEIISISYSAEPLRKERKIGKPGRQEWEGLMCDSTDAAPRKAIMVIMCPEPPAGKDRMVYLHFRNRRSDGSEIGPWSDPGDLKLTGRPQNVD